MANTIKHHPGQSHYTCGQCNTEKPASEFYVNKKRSNGLQCYCKTCCKENNSEFRFRRPTYYWGTESELGYLEKHYDRFMETLKKSTKADKTNKVYSITTPEGTYIGATKSHLHVRKANHKWTYLGYRKGLKKTILPVLFSVLDKYSIDSVESMFNSMCIIEEWEGTKEELMKREGEIIKEWISEGKPVLNIFKTK